MRVRVSPTAPSDKRSPSGEVGRRRGFKIPRRKACRFESGLGHQIKQKCVGGEVGRRTGFRFRRQRWREGSSPSLRTIFQLETMMDKQKFLKVFKPATASVLASVNDLIKRGGVVIEAKEDRVRILREQSVALVDAYGRVTWSVASRADLQKLR